MALLTTQAEMEAFFAKCLPSFLDYLKTHSTSVDKIELVTSLDGVSSMPALYDLGGVQKTVRVPLTLLTAEVQSAIDDANEAIDKCETATSEAEAAAKKVTDAITDISAEKAAALEAATAATNAASSANDAAEAATTATADCKTVAANCQAALDNCKTITSNCEATTEECQSVLDTCKTITENCQSVITTCNTSTKACEDATQECIDATEACKTATSACITATTESKAQTEACKTATDLADEVANHPPKQGDNNWWIYNITTHEYEDSGILFKGGILYPRFYVDVTTMHLMMAYYDEISGELFALDTVTGHLTFKQSI